MAATATPQPQPKTNRIGLTVLDYRGGKTTLCAGCGHNAISERIIDAMFEMVVEPERVMKMSGKLRRIRWTNCPMPIDAVSPSPLTPSATSFELANTAPVVTDGMRP